MRERLSILTFVSAYQNMQNERTFRHGQIPRRRLALWVFFCYDK